MLHETFARRAKYIYFHFQVLRDDCTPSERDGEVRTGGVAVRSLHTFGEGQVMNKNRRSRVMVNQFQGKLLWRFVMYWLIYQVSMWNFMFCWQLLGEGHGNPLEQYYRFVGVNYPGLFCLAILVPFFAWDAMRLTHRVAGPIYRFRQTILSITSGEPVRRIKLRDGDHLNEVADDINEMLDALEERGAITIDRAPGKTLLVASADPQVRLDDGLEDSPKDESLASPTA
jgi:hypothetical protein